MRVENGILKGYQNRTTILYLLFLHILNFHSTLAALRDHKDNITAATAAERDQ